ncbi:MAG: hypothetical protein ABIH68_00380 [bacterium]
MTGKIASELEKVLRDLKEKRSEERENLFSQISERDRQIQELRGKISELKKSHEEEIERLKESIKQQRGQFSNEIGIANEKVRVVEDDNLKFQMEIDALKKQLDTEKRFREEEKASGEKKINSINRNTENLLNHRQKEIVALESRIAKMQEAFNEELAREHSRLEMQIQILKNEIENINGEKNSEKAKATAQIKDRETTIQNLKLEIGMLKGAFKEINGKMRLQREEYEVELKNLDNDWAENLRKKEKEKRELLAQTKNLERDIAAQFSSKFRELETEKKSLSKRIIDLHQHVEEMSLSHERKLVEKDELYRKKIAELREQQIDLQEQYQMKEDELNMIKTELESEIATITGSAKKKEPAPEMPPAAKKEEKPKKGLRKIFGKKETSEPVPDLFKPHPAEDREEPPTAERERQIKLILSQKEESMEELERLLSAAPESEKPEIQKRIDSLKDEITGWQTRLK